MWAILIFGGTAACFVAMMFSALWHLRWVRRLPALDTLQSGPPVGPIRCSVVVAARDEEARIEGTVRGLMAQRGIEAEFIIVDDRSTDGTSEILRRLAKEDARVRVKTVEVLPEGWLGKCHGCHIGASAATGDWILFTDADCWLKPDVIARAVRLAERDGADHVTMSPGTVVEGMGARAWHLLFLTSLLNWFSGVNRDRPKAYIGIGAFNLVRASAYRQCGGYEKLRLTVLDDMRLGLLVRRAGKRTRAFLGVDDVQCLWATSVSGMVKIMEKNYFAALDFRLGLVLLSMIAAVLITGVIVAGFASGTTMGIVAGLSPLLVIIPASILARRLGWSARSALLVPLMFPVFGYTMLKSTFVTLRQNGVRWRGTFYGLDALKAGNVR